MRADSHLSPLRPLRRTKPSRSTPPTLARARTEQPHALSTPATRHAPAPAPCRSTARKRTHAPKHGDNPHPQKPQRPICPAPRTGDPWRESRRLYHRVRTARPKHLSAVGTLSSHTHPQDHCLISSHRISGCKAIIRARPTLVRGRSSFARCDQSSKPTNRAKMLTNRARPSIVQGRPSLAEDLGLISASHHSSSGLIKNNHHSWKTLDKCFSIEPCISIVTSLSQSSIAAPPGAVASCSCVKHCAKRGRISTSSVSWIFALGIGAL